MKSKEEIAEYKKQWALNNKEKLKQQKAEYYKNHSENIKERSGKRFEVKKDEILEKQKEYYQKNKTVLNSKNRDSVLKNPERFKKYLKEYNELNKERIQLKQHEYYLENKEEINQRNRDYYHNNLERIREYEDNRKDWKKIYMRDYKKNRKANDSLFNFTTTIRSLISTAIKRSGYSKNSNTEEIIGCTFEELRIYIEDKFEQWMNWDNYGNWNGYPKEVNIAWDIDHIIPISSAKTEEDIIKLNHYSNLQPLCSYTNRHIKCGRI